jgi:hypothetical protein
MTEILFARLDDVDASAAQAASAAAAQSANNAQQSANDAAASAAELAPIPAALAGGDTGQMLRKASDADYDFEWSSSGTGTVESVDLEVPTGFEVSGGPVTTTGTFEVTYATGYQGYTTTEASKLSGIEDGADVTDATNVAAAGAVMDGDFSADGYMVRTAAGAYASRTFASGTGVTISNTAGTAGNSTVALTSGAQASLALADTAVQPARSISAGTGLAGGGNLSADRTIALQTLSRLSRRTVARRDRCSRRLAGQISTWNGSRSGARAL